MKNNLKLVKKPFCPREWEIKEHHPLPVIDAGGRFKWNEEVQASVLCPSSSLFGFQQRHRQVDGYQLVTEIQARKIVSLNACYLDTLLEREGSSHPKWTPELWIGKMVLFPATIYRNHRDANKLYIRVSYWHLGQFTWYFLWLGSLIPEQSFVAVAASGLNPD